MAKNRITVSSFGKKKRKISHLYFFSQQTISHSDNKEQEKSTATLASCKDHIHWHAAQARRSKQDNAYKNIEKSPNATHLCTGKQVSVACCQTSVVEPSLQELSLCVSCVPAASFYFSRAKFRFPPQKTPGNTERLFINMPAVHHDDDMNNNMTDRKLVHQKRIISVISFGTHDYFFKYIPFPVTLKTFQHLLIIDSDRVKQFGILSKPCPEGCYLLSCKGWGKEVRR